ncbi:MAG: EamA family transporter [Methanobrevibacter sp.]|nr:EamA family transporter [Methanobrevibacter sp.]
MNKKNLLFLQTAVFIYSISGVASKLASNYEFLSFGFILCYGMEILILGIYALLWQQIIKKTDLSVAYTNKATTIFWSMIWSFLIFKEEISVKNLVGVLVIFLGMLMVNKDV